MYEISHTLASIVEVIGIYFLSSLYFSKPTPVAELLALQKSQKSGMSSKHKGANLESSSSEESGLPKVSDFEMAQLKRQMECVSKEIHLCRIFNQRFQTLNCLMPMN